MRINIRGASSAHNFEVDAEPEWTVLQLKEQIAERVRAAGGESTPVATDRIRLIHMARVLENEKRLSETSIVEGQTVHMVLRQVDLPPSPGPQQQSVGAAPTSVPQMDIVSQMLSSLPGIIGGVVQSATTAAAGAAPQTAAAPSVSPGATTAAQSHGAPPQPAFVVHHHQQHHHHHHHHHQMMMLQHQQLLQQQLRQQQQQQQQMAQLQPFVAGVHVHVHVNFSELDALPARLEQLRRQAPFVSGIQTHVLGGQEQTQSPQAPPQAGQQRTTASAASASTTQQSAAQQPPPAQAHQQPHGSPAAAAAGPRPTIAQLAAQAGIVDAGESEAPESLLDVFSRNIMSSFDVPQLMSLIGGSWMPIEKLRDPARQFIRTWSEQNGNVSLASGGEGRQRFAASSARSLIQSMVENHDVYSLLRPRQREGVNMFLALEQWAYVVMLEMTNHILDSGAGAAFTGPLRVIIVRAVGRLFHYAQRELLRNGPADLDHIIQNLIRILIATAAREQPALGQHLQAMGPMALGIAMNTLGQWHQEYQVRFRSESDDSVFTTSIPVFQPIMQRPQASAEVAATRSGGPAATVDMDALLDEAMNEAGTPPPAAAASPAARAALVAGGIPVEEVDDAVRALQRSASSGTPSEIAAHSDIFNALRNSQ